MGRTMHHRWAIPLVLVLFLFVSRLIVLDPPGLPTRNLDEEFMAIAATAPFFGGPQNYLVWPGGLQRFAMMAIVPLDFIFASADSAGSTIERFAVHLGTRMRDPSVYIAALRYLSVLSTVGGFVLLYFAMARQAAGRWGAALLALVGATAPILWVRSTMATPDASATALVACAIAVALLDRRIFGFAVPVVAGLLLGFASATKFTAFLAGPFLLFAVLPRERWLRATAAFIASVVVGHVLLDPTLASEPLRVLKALLGNIMTREVPPHGHLLPLIEALPLWISLPGTVAALALLITGADWRQRMFGLGGLLTMVGIVVMNLGADFIDPQYYLPLIPILLGVMAVWPRLWTPFGERPRMAAASFAAILAVTTVFGFTSIQRRDRIAHDRYVGLFAFPDLVLQLAREGRITGPFYAQPYPIDRLARWESRESLIARADQLGGLIGRGTSATRFLANRGLRSDIVQAMPGLFDDSERLLVARMRLMALAPPTQPAVQLNIVAPAEDSSGRYGGIPPSEARALYLAGRIQWLLALDPIPGRMPYAVLPGTHTPFGKYLYGPPPAAEAPVRRPPSAG